MLRILQQPFPRNNHAARVIKTALAIGSFVFIFLFVFRPFGLQEMGTKPLAAAVFFYGLLCFLILAGYFLIIPHLFSRVYEESGWTVWKEILHTIVCILAVSAGNIAFTHFYFGQDIDGKLVGKLLWMTFCVAIIPITLLVLIRQVRLTRTYSRQAAELDQQLQGLSAPGPKTARLPAAQLNNADLPIPDLKTANLPAPDSEAPLEIHFPLENGQEAFDLPLGSFLYAEAADNYVKLYYVTQGKPTQKMIRSTLKRLEEAFRGHDRIYRCHRTYIVNLEKVIHINGNAQGYKLHLDGAQTPIPVSRNLNGEIAGLVIRPKPLPDSPFHLQ
jgi:DNA-binding LytR/AlgR family response regulator